MTVSLLLALGVVALIVCFALLTLERTLVSLFFGTLLFGLAGYMFLGRGFAYAGVPPVFVSELFLGLAVCALVYSISWKKLHLVEHLIIIFMVCGAARTLPYIQTYDIDALRDAVVWAYAAFALAVSVVLTPRLLVRATAGYARLLPVFLLWVPFLFMLQVQSLVPLWPVSGVPTATLKPGDMAVHLVGVMAFFMSGLYQSSHLLGLRLTGWVRWTMLLVAFATTSLSRAALLTGIAASAVAFLLWPSRHVMSLICVLIVAGLLVIIANPRIEIGGGQGRSVSVEQVRENLLSIVRNNGDEASSNLQGTKEWRQRWWDDIWDYTVNGPYFFGGKGFGINLADDDGYQVNADGSLRSPHNGHLTILARMGVPGLALWIALQSAFGYGLMTALLRARRAGLTFWAQVDGWILVYWIALMVNISFDVYLEGPQGGIWLWSVMGFGLGAMRLQRELHSGGGAGTARLEAELAR